MTVNQEFMAIVKRMAAITRKVGAGEILGASDVEEAMLATADYDVHVRSYAEMYEDDTDDDDEGLDTDEDSDEDE